MYAYTWCLFSFCGCVQSNFTLNSNQIILMETLFQLFLTHLQFGPRTSFWFRHTCVLVFRKMSFLIHFIFTFLKGIIFRPLFTTFYPCFMIIFLIITCFSHKLQLRGHSSWMEGNLMFDKFPSLPRHFSHWIFYYLAVRLGAFMMSFLLVITHFSNSMHIPALGDSSLFSSINCFTHSLNAVLRFWHSLYVLSYGINSTYLSYVSGQGLPLASYNVKYWCFIRWPF